MGCRFSIIVPTHNRPDQLVLCLKAMVALHYPTRGFEVLVVNDGGVLPSERELAEVSAAIPLTILSQQRAGPARARNLGAMQACGEILAFTDDDCAPMPNWLAALDDTIQRTPYALVGGRTVNVLPHSPCSEASQLLIEYLYGYYNGDVDRGAKFFASNNMAISASGFRDLRGFDSSFGRAAAEDRDLCARWHRAGGRFCYVPEAVVRHAHAMSLASFARQHFRYGRGAFQYRVRHSIRNRQRVRVEPLAFYVGLLGFPFRRYSRLWAAKVGLLMGFSQVANAAGFFWERGATKLRKSGGKQCVKLC